MSELTSAIVARDLEAIAFVISRDESLVFQQVDGWLPVEWAEGTGDFRVLARFLRLSEFPISRVKSERLCRKCLIADFFQSPARQGLDVNSQGVWEAIFHGGSIPDSSGSIESILDLRFLLEALELSRLPEFGEFLRQDEFARCLALRPEPAALPI